MRSNFVVFIKELGLTQNEFGLIFNKSKQHINNIAHNRSDGSIDLWLDIGIKFNLSVKQLKELREVS